MGASTGIPWCDATLNFWIGCRKVSPGCTNCYAEADNKRYGHDFSVLRRTSAHLWNSPRRWKEPKRIFVGSWMDFFIGAEEYGVVGTVIENWREAAWDVMIRNDHHTYLILTKRAENMLAFAQTHIWPAHIWAGVTVESQQYVSRLDALAQVPAKVRFISGEPLLGPLVIDLKGHGIGWLITGGESGPHARPMHPDWPRSLRDQCQAADVPFFFKQWGEWMPVRDYIGSKIPARNIPAIALRQDGSRAAPIEIVVGPATSMARVGRKAAGCLLDGVRHDAVPERRA